MSNSSDHNTAIQEDLAELTQIRIRQLRQRWRQLFRTDPPAAFGPDLLRRSIAQKLQEQHYGGLPSSAQRELDQITKLIEDKPNGRIELPRRIKSGAVLVRGWKGKTHRVTVLDDGFAYEGITYTRLSEIARNITGTRWNGPRFFGLRRADLNKSTALDEPNSKIDKTMRGSAQEPSASMKSTLVTKEIARVA